MFPCRRTTLKVALCFRKRLVQNNASEIARTLDQMSDTTFDESCFWRLPRSKKSKAHQTQLPSPPPFCDLTHHPFDVSAGTLVRRNKKAWKFCIRVLMQPERGSLDLARRATFAVRPVRGLHGQEENLAFSLHAELSAWWCWTFEKKPAALDERQRVQMEWSRRETQCALLPPACSHSAPWMAQQCPLLSTAVTTNQKSQVSQAGSGALHYKRSEKLFNKT